MNFFRKIQSEGLRRLVKVVLNRTIGPFLENPIELEQLELESETGLFHIKDVPLDCAALNEFLADSPVRISAASVHELTVTISWAAVNDGCKITLDGVNLSLCRAQAFGHPREARGSAAEGEEAEGSSSPRAASESDDGEEEEGVIFLANWIDVIVSRFHVQLKNISIDIAGGSEAASPVIRFRLDEMNYFNSKPEPSGGGSLAGDGVNGSGAMHSVSVASESVSRTRGRGRPAVASVVLLSSQEAHNSKLLTFSGFRVDIISSESLGSNSVLIDSELDEASEVVHRYRCELLRCDGKGRVLIRTMTNKQLQSTSTDVNITLPPVSSYINVRYIAVISGIADSFASAIPSAPDDASDDDAAAGHVFGGGIYGVQDKFRAITFERTMKVLDGIGDDALSGPLSEIGDGVDVAKVTKMLKMYQDIRHRLEAGSDSEMSAYMSDAFSSAVDPTGREGERAGFSYREPVDGRTSRSLIDTDIASVVSEEEDGIVLSDGDVDVSSVEDGSGEGDFFDTSEGQGMSRASIKRPERTVSIKEPLKPTSKSMHPSRSIKSTQRTGFSLRFIVPSVDIILAEVASGATDISHSLKLSFGDLHTSLQVPAPSSSDAPVPPTHLTLKISKIALVESTIKPDRPIVFPMVYFGDFSNSENKEVFPVLRSAPSVKSKFPQAGGISITDDTDFELAMDFSNRKSTTDCKNANRPDVSLSFKLNPLVVVISPDVVLRWVDELKPLMMSSDADSSSSFSLVVDLPSVNVLLCPTTSSLRPKPIDVLRMLGILDEGNAFRRLKYSRWMQRDCSIADHSRKSMTSFNRFRTIGRPAADNPFIDNPHDTFFRINLNNVRVRLQSAVDRSSSSGEWYIPAPILELNEISAYMRLETHLVSTTGETKEASSAPGALVAFELKFISSLSSSDRKISVRKFAEADFSQDATAGRSQLPSILKSRMSRKEFRRAQSAGSADKEPAPSKLPLPPPLHGGEIFVIDAHLIRLDLQRKEYSLFIGLIDIFVPPSRVNEKKESSIETKDVKAFSESFLPKGIGVKLTAEIFLCSLSQDEKIECEVVPVKESTPRPSKKSQINEDRYTYILSTREPLIEFYQSYRPKKSADGSTTFESQIFIGLEVENVSAFELTDEQMKKTPFCASGISTIGVRIGPEAHNIPIVHVTTFARDWMQADGNGHSSAADRSFMTDSVVGGPLNLAGAGDDRKWTLSIGALITENKELNTLNTLLHIDFQDVTVRYDPLSRWLMNVIDIVTPLTLPELIPSYELKIVPKENALRVLQPPVETLHLKVSVRQALLDYCAITLPTSNSDGVVIHPGTVIPESGPVTAPRVLVSLGQMLVATTFVSTSHQTGLKIGVNDISLRLTNSILRDSRFELVPLDVNGVLSTQGLATQPHAHAKDFRPCCRYFEDFIDVHSFVRMGKVRKIEMMLRLNGGVKTDRSGEEIDDDSDKIDVSAQVDDIYCCGCADSLNVFADAINTLVADLKEAAEFEAPEAPAGQKKKLPLAATEVEKKSPKLVYKDKPQSLESESGSEDESDDIFGSYRRTESLSSKHSSHDDLILAHQNPSKTSPSGRTVLRPPALQPANSARTGGNVHHLLRDDAVQRPKDEELSSAPFNILSGIDTSMFAPKSRDDDTSSRMSVRSTSDSVLIEAIYDDDYFAAEEASLGGSGADGDEADDFNFQFKRSEKLPIMTDTASKVDMKFVKLNTVAKKRSLFNSAFDDETEAMLIADMPGDDVSEEDEDEVYSEEEFPSSEEKQKPQWSIFRPKPEQPEDHELLPLPAIGGMNIEDTMEAIPPFDEKPLAPSIPVAPWKASAAAGTDDGVNIAAFQEESTSLQGEDTFLVVDYNDPNDNGRPEVKWFDGKEQLSAARVNPHHIPVLVSAEEAEEIEAVSPKILVKVTMSLKFQLLRGHDWSSSETSSSKLLRKQLLKKGGVGASSRSNSNKASDNIPSAGKGHRVLFADDKLQKKSSGSVPVGAPVPPVNKDRAELSLNGVSVRFAMYAPDEETIATWPVQRTIVKVNDIDVKFYRRNHRTKKVLGYWKSHVPRETNAPILNVHLDTFVDTVCKSHGPKDDPSASFESVHSTRSGLINSAKVPFDRDIEHVNKISIVLLPLSCHLDAPFLDLVRSLGESFKPAEDSKESAEAKEKEKQVVEEGERSSVPASVSLHQLERERPLFFQQWKMSPISLKIYYEPRAFDIVKFQAGDYIEILNCFPLDGLEITMKRTILYGVTGVQGGVDNTLRLWVDQIRENQLSTIGKVLSGVAPLKGVASIGKGLHHHLFVMPRKEFNRRGTSGALQSVAGGVAAVGGTVFREAMHVGAQATQMLANLLNRVAEPLAAEHGAAQRRGHPSRHSSELVDSRRVDYDSRPRVRAANAPQPASAAEGGQMAIDAFSSSVASAVDNIVLVPIREYQRSGTGGVISSVIRAVPIAVLGPAAGAAQAVSYTLLGMRNQVDPARRREEEAIYVDIEKSEQFTGSYRG